MSVQKINCKQNKSKEKKPFWQIAAEVKFLEPDVPLVFVDWLNALGNANRDKVAGD